MNRIKISINYLNEGRIFVDSKLKLAELSMTHEEERKFTTLLST